MKNLRKNNKGFSLVELIVVVLIMAIIAVALAPQVLKWVNNSRIAADQDTINAVKTAANLTYANEDLYNANKDNEVKITISKSANLSITGENNGAGGTNFENKFFEYAGVKDASGLKFKSYTSLELKYVGGKLTNPEDIDSLATIDQ